MNYNITTIAREYIPRRYPNASTYEQEKYIADWVRKIDTSRKIIKDMESRFGEKLLGKKVFDSGTGMGGVVVYRSNN